ncbi:MAG TPA: hypothetical protein VGU69_05055 [Rhizomicrobium sp.]|nr:hypothetical protein [Rhizomicrobium sp.]
MARETAYFVRAYKVGRGNGLKADAAVLCKSADAARRKAEMLVATSAGVVAFSTSGDAELGDFDEEPTLIFKSGRLPPPFDE